MKGKTLAAFLGVVAAVLVAVFFFTKDDGDARDGATPKRRRHGVRIERRVPRDLSAKESVRKAMSGYKPQKRRPLSAEEKKRRHDYETELFGRFQGKDREAVEALQTALDANDFEAVVASVATAGASANPEVRMQAVTALGWFGAESLPELTVFMADKDEDVANEAAEQWQLGLSEIDDDEVRAATAEVAMCTLNHEDAMQQIVGEITGQSDELKIVQALVDIIDSGNRVGMEIAKEEYESLTGEEWTNVDDAEAWLQENYEPEEDDDRQDEQSEEMNNERNEQ